VVNTRSKGSQRGKPIQGLLRFGRWLVVTIIVTAGLLGAPLAAHAVSLAWDPNTEPEVTGYRVYMGLSSRSYSSVMDAGTNTTEALPFLQSGVTYYFAVTAYTGTGLESDFSDEVSYTAPGTKPPPVATNDTYSTTNGATLNVPAATGVLANDYDAQGSVLTALLATGPANGVLNLRTNGSFVYTPATSSAGTDTFTYAVTDGNATSAVATVTITLVVQQVTATNRPPVAVNDAYSTTNGAVLSVSAGSGVLANDSDPDGDPLSVVPVTTATNGTLSLQPNGSFSYSPRTSAAGTDRITYYVTDGKAASGVATVSITLVAVATNTPPVATNDTYATTNGAMLNVTAARGVLANDFDANHDTLTAVLVSNPAKGSLSLQSSGAFVYTPSLPVAGTDSFTYRASDGKATSAVATVTITLVLTATNTPPVATNDTYATTNGAVLNVAANSGVLANDFDANGDVLTALLVAAPTRGTLTLQSSGAFVYAPTGSVAGADSFTYRASDGKATSAVTTVTITLYATTTSTNQAPVAVDDAYATTNGIALNVPAESGVLTNDYDPDGDPMTVLLVSSTVKGVLTLQTNGAFRYLPNTTGQGADTFTYQVTDGRATSEIATVTISLILDTPPPPNHTPVASSDAYATTNGAALNVGPAAGLLANDYDADGDALTALLVTPPSNGSLNLGQNGGFLYLPNSGVAGSDSFSYCVTDGTATSGVATVSITLISQNHAPVALNAGYATTNGAPLTVPADAGLLAHLSDPDGDPVTLLVLSEPAHGTLTVQADGSFVYVPDNSGARTDSFTFAGSDGKAASSQAAVTIELVDQTPCRGCFAALDTLLSRRSNDFPQVAAARHAAYADTNCLGAGLSMFRAMMRTIHGVPDSQLAAALSAAADCLRINLEAKTTEQGATIAGMATSQWSLLASNRTESLEEALAQLNTWTNVVTGAKALLASAKQVSRIDGLISRGIVAPAALSNCMLQCTFPGKPAPTKEIIRFQGQLFTIQATNGAPIGAGNFVFTRTTWLTGTLDLTFDTGESTTFSIQFTKTRVRLSNAAIRGTGKLQWGQ